MADVDYLGSLRDDGAALAADGVTELLEVFLAPHAEGSASDLPLFLWELAAAATQ